MVRACQIKQRSLDMVQVFYRSFLRTDISHDNTHLRSKPLIPSSADHYNQP